MTAPLNDSSTAAESTATESKSGYVGSAKRRLAPDYKTDIVKIAALGIFGMIGLLGLWGVDELLALCERHKWWIAATVVAVFGLWWAVVFVLTLIRFAWMTRRRYTGRHAKRRLPTLRREAR